MGASSLPSGHRGCICSTIAPSERANSLAAAAATMEAMAEHLRRNLAALQANLQRSVQDVAAQAAALCQGAHMRRQPSGLAPLFAVSPWGRHQLACEVP